MHVFLTGDIQVGKSTLTKKVLSAMGEVRLGGFRTVTVDDRPDAFGSLYIVPAAAEKPVCGDENRVGIRRGHGRGTEGFPEVFDRAGTEVLAGAEDCELILMDEIGKLEADSPLFLGRIAALLDGDVPIFGVLRREGETPQQMLVRSHPKVRLIEVTEQNRDALASEITALLQAQMK